MTTTVAHLLVLLLATTGAGSPAPSPAPAGAGHRTPAAGVWPLQPEPRVVAGFRPPATRYGPGHRGVDLAGRPGQVVRAAVGGRVTYAGSLAGRGVVVVGHGSTRTTYEPVRATVGLGAAVAAGDRIGRLEPHGSHCAPAVCLHWGLLEGDTYLDPLTLVGAGPVRLLPLQGLATAAAPWRAGRTRTPARSPGGAGLSLVTTPRSARTRAPRTGAAGGALPGAAGGARPV